MHNKIVLGPHLSKLSGSQENSPVTIPQNIGWLGSAASSDLSNAEATHLETILATKGVSSLISFKEHFVAMQKSLLMSGLYSAVFVGGSAARSVFDFYGYCGDLDIVILVAPVDRARKSDVLDRICSVIDGNPIVFNHICLYRGAGIDKVFRICGIGAEVGAPFIATIDSLLVDFFSYKVYALNPDGVTVLGDETILNQALSDVRNHRLSLHPLVDFPLQRTSKYTTIGYLEESADKLASYVRSFQENSTVEIYNYFLKYIDKHYPSDEIRTLDYINLLLICIQNGGETLLPQLLNVRLGSRFVSVKPKDLSDVLDVFEGLLYFRAQSNKGVKILKGPQGTNLYGIVLSGYYFYIRARRSEDEISIFFLKALLRNDCRYLFDDLFPPTPKETLEAAVAEILCSFQENVRPILEMDGRFKKVLQKFDFQKAVEESKSFEKLHGFLKSIDSLSKNKTVKIDDLLLNMTLSDGELAWLDRQTGACLHIQEIFKAYFQVIPDKNETILSLLNFCAEIEKIKDLDARRQLYHRFMNWIGVFDSANISLTSFLNLAEGILLFESVRQVNSGSHWSVDTQESAKPRFVYKDNAWYTGRRSCEQIVRHFFDALFLSDYFPKDLLPSDAWQYSDLEIAKVYHSKAIKGLLSYYRKTNWFRDKGWLTREACLEHFESVLNENLEEMRVQKDFSRQVLKGDPLTLNDFFRCFNLRSDQWRVIAGHDELKKLMGVVFPLFLSKQRTIDNLDELERLLTIMQTISKYQIFVGKVKPSSLAGILPSVIHIFKKSLDLDSLDRPIKCYDHLLVYSDLSKKSFKNTISQLLVKSMFANINQMRGAYLKESLARFTMFTGQELICPDDFVGMVNAALRYLKSEYPKEVDKSLKKLASSSDFRDVVREFAIEAIEEKFKSNPRDDQAVLSLLIEHKTTVEPALLSKYVCMLSLGKGFGPVAYRNIAQIVCEAKETIPDEIQSLLEGNQKCFNIEDVLLLMELPLSDEGFAKITAKYAAELGDRHELRLDWLKCLSLLEGTENTCLVLCETLVKQLNLAYLWVIAYYFSKKNFSLTDRVKSILISLSNSFFSIKSGDIGNKVVLLSLINHINKRFGVVQEETKKIAFLNHAIPRLKGEGDESKVEAAINLALESQLYNLDLCQLCIRLNDKIQTLEYVASQLSETSLLDLFKKLDWQKSRYKNLYFEYLAKSKNSRETAIRVKYELWLFLSDKIDFWNREISKAYLEITFEILCSDKHDKIYALWKIKHTESLTKAFEQLSKSSDTNDHLLILRILNKLLASASEVAISQPSRKTDIENYKIFNLSLIKWMTFQWEGSLKYCFTSEEAYFNNPEIISLYENIYSDFYLASFHCFMMRCLLLDHQDTLKKLEKTIKDFLHLLPSLDREKLNFLQARAVINNCVIIQNEFKHKGLEKKIITESKISGSLAALDCTIQAVKNLEISDKSKVYSAISSLLVDYMSLDIIAELRAPFDPNIRSFFYEEVLKKTLLMEEEGILKALPEHAILLRVDAFLNLGIKLSLTKLTPDFLIKSLRPLEHALLSHENKAWGVQTLMQCHQTLFYILKDRFFKISDVESMIDYLDELKRLIHTIFPEGVKWSGRVSQIAIDQDKEVVYQTVFGYAKDSFIRENDRQAFSMLAVFVLLNTARLYYETEGFRISLTTLGLHSQPVFDLPLEDGGKFKILKAQIELDGINTKLLVSEPPPIIKLKRNLDKIDNCAEKLKSRVDELLALLRELGPLDLVEENRVEQLACIDVLYEGWKIWCNPRLSFFKEV